jgi:Fe-S oxidoreductase
MGTRELSDMALADYKNDMMRCMRCSECKWIPLAKISNWRFAHQCPSISRYKFHAYSGGGRLAMGLSMLEGRIGYTNDFLDILYRCNMCGACEVSCKCNKDLENMAIAQELRIKSVEDGQLLPQHMLILDSLRKEDNTMLAKKADRGKWAEGIAVKNINEEKAEVYFHAGCRYCFDEELWPQARAALNILLQAGVDVAIAGKDESCCACRVYEMGYLGELTKYAESNEEMLKTAGVKTIVTPCSDCYAGFKVQYPKIGKMANIEVLHITEYIDRLLKSGELKLKKKISMTVTYHDPCHLGRLGEPFIPWNGKEKIVFNQMYIYDPPKPWRKGTNGVYEIPRDVIKAVPGLKLAEMTRIKEYSWCCGAGGGVIESYPDFAIWTALERIEEAKSTGAEALVTACPWCKRNFLDALKESGDKLKILDIVELVEQSI